MGYDIIAYFDIDQDEIENFIQTYKIDRENWENIQLVVDYFTKTHLGNLGFTYACIHYDWNKKCNMHEIYTMFGTNFIRDDERLSNERFHKHLEKKIGKPFPHCLSFINWSLRKKEDAVEIANQLHVFFEDDPELMEFAEWLEQTSNYCSFYDLSC